jgi:hypothetical protein
MGLVSTAAEVVAAVFVLGLLATIAWYLWDTLF